MKTVLIYLLFSAITIYNALSQIGINTDNPQQLFHLDGASSAATTNPENGAISAIQATDDVVINSEGYVGIGTSTPSTQLHISSGSIKIDDGSQQERRVLISDADGNASWGAISGTWFAVLHDGGLPPTQTPGMRQVTFNSSIISDPTNGAVNASTGTITVPFTGYYKLVLAAYFGNNFNDYPKGNLFIAYPWVYVNGSLKYNPHVIGLTKTFGIAPTFIQPMKLNAGSIISLFNNEALACSNQISQVSLILEFIQ